MRGSRDGSFRYNDEVQTPNSIDAHWSRCLVPLRSSWAAIVFETMSKITYQGCKVDFDMQFNAA